MKPYDLKDAFEVYNEAVERKTDTSAKAELRSIEVPVRDCYINYANHFRQNDLEYMPQARVGQMHKGALLSLYGSKTKLVRNFRSRFFDINPQTYNNLCPYCTINTSDTTEHILPKEKYPEYAVDVLNLIPGCSECNYYKGEDVLDKDGKKFIINFYTDTLPDVQFLFVDVTNDGSGLKMRYRLENVNNAIEPGLYTLIEKHFNKLHLLDKFDDKAIQQFAEIANTYLVEKFQNDQQYDLFAAKQILKCDMDVPAYGRNYWKVVLVRSCAMSNVFKQYIMQRTALNP